MKYKDRVLRIKDAWLDTLSDNPLGSVWLHEYQHINNITIGLLKRFENSE